MRFRLRSPRFSRLFRTRRLAVFASVSALVLGLGVSSAFASSSAVDDSLEKLRILSQFAYPSDWHPRDLQVAAPSFVIGATLSGNTSTIGREILDYRPNTSDWVDSKERLAAGSGLSTADLDSTSRWKPRLTKFVPVVGGLMTGGELAYMVRDGYLYSTLKIPSNTDEKAFCLRDGNVVTDFFTGIATGSNCGDFRLNENFNALVGDVVPMGVGTIAGISRRAASWVPSGSTTRWYCYTFPTQHSYVDQTKHLLQMIGANGSTIGTIAGFSHASSYTQYCGSGYVNAMPNAVALRLVDSKTGQTLESMTIQDIASDLEWVTRVRCLDGSIRYAISESFQQKALGAVAQPASVQLSGCQPVGVDVGAQKKGLGAPSPSTPFPSTPGGDRYSAATSEVPTEVQDWMRDSPNCWDGSCLLDLRKVLGGSMEMDCFDSPDQCVDWQTSVQADPQTYRCYYGGQLVAISECNVYGRVFDRDKVQQGTAYTDPTTGQPVTTSTGTAVSTNPGAATTAMSSGAADPSQPRQCFPSGWGVFNPFEWVFQPVKCALEWAFVPRATKLSQVQTKIQLAAVNSVPAQMVQGLNGWTAVVPSSSGCMGPLIEFDIAGLNYSAYPLQACDGALATAANFSRIALTIIAILTGIIAITRYVARIFGFSGVGEGGSA